MMKTNETEERQLNRKKLRLISDDDRFRDTFAWKKDTGSYSCRFCTHSRNRGTLNSQFLQDVNLLSLVGFLKNEELI